jgi:hypothetical protein
VSGVLHGKVSVLSQIGMAYVIEDGTGHRFALARNLDQQRFDELRVGQSLAFRANDFNAVAQIVD